MIQNTTTAGSTITVYTVTPGKAHDWAQCGGFYAARHRSGSRFPQTYASQLGSATHELAVAYDRDAGPEAPDMDTLIARHWRPGRFGAEDDARAREEARGLLDVYVRSAAAEDVELLDHECFVQTARRSLGDGRCIVLSGRMDRVARQPDGTIEVLDLKTGAWTIYDQSNTVMHEPWVYAVKGAKDRVYVGVWGGGILEYEFSSAVFKEHRDPDRDFHFDLVPDDGPVNDITAWIAWDQGILWQATYFGMSRYDGSRWRTWQEKKSPLLSNFLNFIWARGRVAWVGTDRGVSVTDGDTWVNYRTSEKGEGLMEIARPGQPVETKTMSTHLANDFVLGLWADDREAWFATSDGLSHATFIPSQEPASTK